jgi:hypothetical protein
VTTPPLNTYRILWVDAAGNGRFTDLQHTSAGAAAWAVALDAASGSGVSSRFVGMVQLADPAADPDPGPVFEQPAAPTPAPAAEAGQDQAPAAGQDLNPLELNRLPDPPAAPFPYGGPPPGP